MAGTGLTHGVWLERVPDLAKECAEEWALRLGEPYLAGAAGYTVRADLPDGTPAVLKLIYPHRESEHEAEALALWNGEGAVRLLEYDEDRWALLIERCEPGTKLAEIDADEALDVIVGLLPRLWKNAGEPFHSLADEAVWWVEYLPREWERAGRPCERSLLDAATDALQQLSSSQGEQILLHQDLHGDNVLAAQREPWLTIDPKPLIGEREFSVAPIVRSFELGGTRADVLHRLDRLTSELGLDRERSRWWTIGQTVAWAFDSRFQDQHLETVRWLLEHP
ncbi:MAG TPA: aminoglycoside phosphotransferase family protein [Gaiellaceae bacterium]